MFCVGASEARLLHRLPLCAPDRGLFILAHLAPENLCVKLHFKEPFSPSSSWGLFSCHFLFCSFCEVLWLHSQAASPWQDWEEYVLICVCLHLCVFVSMYLCVCVYVYTYVLLCGCLCASECRTCTHVHAQLLVSNR